jgi:gamma-butyrobetaine dioxygenase
MQVDHVAYDDRFLTVTWADGQVSRHALIWTRDNDPAGFHPHTGEREFDLLSVPEAPQLSEAGCEAETLRLLWQDGHETRLPTGWLRARADEQGLRTIAPVAPESWDASFAGRIPRHDHAAVLQDDGALRAWLEDLVRYGLAIVSEVPPECGALEAVCRRIAHLRETNFGVIFDVRSVPRPNNQAYTADALPFHTDLPNQETPPGFQFLHTLENDAEGGESTFADASRIAEDLAARDPEAYRLLRDVAIPFRFHDADWDIRYRRPVIREDAMGRPVEINYNAHIADSFDLDPDETLAYYRAYRAFMAATRETGYAIRMKTKPGDLAAFNNRRILHGRTAFDPNTGRRHLRGCYVDWSDLMSRLRVLRRGRA